MKSTATTLRAHKILLRKSLKEQLLLFYQLRRSLRTARFNDSRSMGQVLNIWTQIHQQQIHFESLLKPFLNETKY